MSYTFAGKKMPSSKPLEGGLSVKNRRTKGGDGRNSMHDEYSHFVPEQSEVIQLVSKNSLGGIEIAVLNSVVERG